MDTSYPFLKSDNKFPNAEYVTDSFGSHKSPSSIYCGQKSTFYYNNQILFIYFCFDELLVFNALNINMLILNLVNIPYLAKQHLALCYSISCVPSVLSSNNNCRISRKRYSIFFARCLFVFPSLLMMIPLKIHCGERTNFYMELLLLTSI